VITSCASFSTYVPSPMVNRACGSLIACPSANPRPRHFLLSARLFAENAASDFSLIHSISVI
jgi:hypothetical protein